MAWRRLFSSPSLFLLHLSLLLVAVGAILTWTLRRKGSLRILPGATAEVFVSDSDGSQLPLPVPVSLIDFEVVDGVGGDMPRDYVSRLLVDGDTCVVSVNRVLTLSGYRLSQSSYDSEGATVLAVSRDPWGMGFCYSGFLLFGAAGLWILVAPRGRFRRELRSLGVVALTSLFPGVCGATSVAGVPRDVADSMRTVQVVYSGRVVTFNTCSRDVVKRIYGSPVYRGLTPEQTVMSFSRYPERWKNLPIVRIDDDVIASRLGVKGGYASLSDFFDASGRYRLPALYSSVGQRHVGALEETDVKVGLLLEIVAGNLAKPLPEGMESKAEWRVRLELLYNSLPLGSMAAVILFCGFLAEMASLAAGGMSARLHLLPRLCLAGATLVSALNFVLVWILAERIPLSNTSETLSFVVMMLELLLFGAAWRHIGGALLPALGMLFAGALSVASGISAPHPLVSSLMPVLHTPWLSIHVTLVMCSYAILGFTAVAAVAGLASGRMAGEMRNLSLALLWPGVWLLGLGIATGSVWAEMSWGSYWSWDPKETWALVTLCVYSFPLHQGAFRRVAGRGARGFHVYMLAALAAIAMTWFGVNFLDSLHSYG